MPLNIERLYTFASQVITPDKFWNIASKTGDTLEVKNDNTVYRLGIIVNPKKLMKSIKK